ncbi:MAG: ABC transporter permease [Acidimicrobiia bacterium]|nr:ABC transporter permease [Acidimicrobiia bacterium]MDQ3499990.1 ABC transporter permease [Actinomycetota bacterium]
MTFLLELLGATLRNATPLVYGTIGETYSERAGVLNLGIEGTMYAGAFFGFAAAAITGSRTAGLLAAIAVGLAAGALMGLLTVTIGTNQHVAGIGTTLGLIGISEYVNRLWFGSGQGLSRIEPYPPWEPLGPNNVFSQYGLTYVAFFLLAPLAWWVLARTHFGLNLRAVGENPEAADSAGVNVARTRYAALMIGGALMAVGGAFFTLAALGSFTLDIIAGRGWVCIALVIFGRWRVWRGVAAALLFAAVYALQLRLRILEEFQAIPFELLLALPYLVVIAALVISGRNVAYPGAYLKPYRRE